MADTPQTRWDAELIAAPDRWQSYVDRFTDLHCSGADTDGEARFIDAIAARGSAILDAGCGAGRVGAALLARGHEVAGIDKDAGQIEVGRARYPELPLLAHDLLTVDAATLARLGLPDQLDIVVLAGNVMVYLAPGTERAVLSQLASLLKPGGRLVTGFATGHAYRLDQLDADAAATGLALRQRFGTWQLAPYDESSEWAVSLFALEPEG